VKLRSLAIMKTKNFDLIVDQYLDRSVEWVDETFSVHLSIVSGLVNSIVEALNKLLLMPPFYITMILFGVLAWKTSGPFMAFFTFIGLLFCYVMNLWDATIGTLSLVLVSTSLALLIAIPLGILSALVDSISKVTRPLMDFLQTMPPYVHLIPALILLGYNRSAAVFTVSIAAFPPALRLTDLGIRQVPVEQVEAGRAFGATPGQILLKIQLFSAFSTIMTGINQCLMIALSMSVIAGMIGGGGLGKEVYKALSSLQIDKSIDTGLAIVLLAIILDRISQGSPNIFKKN